MGRNGVDNRFAEERKEPPKGPSKNVAPQTPGINPVPPTAAAGGR